MTAIRTILFDLNGVFIDAPALSQRFQTAYGVPVEEFLPALKQVMGIARLPDAGDSFALWKPYLEKWGIGLTREDFFDLWFSAEQDNTNRVELAQRLKTKGFRLFLISNNFRERTDYYAGHFPWINEIFEKAYYSWQTGLVKPNPEAYELILTENRLNPEECAYFDDSAENLASAASLGILAFPANELETKLSQP